MTMPTKTTSPSIAQTFLAELDAEMPPTRRLLERVPDAKGDWKPHPKSFSLAHLSQLVARMPGWLTLTMHEPSLDLSGRVYGRNCTPLAAALLDFWHADDRGVYDNAGFRLRGHQYTDAQGRYRLSTILPGVYTGRTRHIHVRVQPSGGRLLTTQLYFPGEPRNKRDGLFRAELLVSLDAKQTPRQGRFHFLLDA